MVAAGLACAGAHAEEEEARDLRVGDEAPAFRLNDEDGRARSLAKLHEEAWVVLAFFPKADTPG
jgi:peroxiredoxin Q/BCP